MKSMNNPSEKQQYAICMESYSELPNFNNMQVLEPQLFFPLAQILSSKFPQQYSPFEQAA